jgi:predicted class III extradiol MEMO1 family dioxygenase
MLAQLREGYSHLTKKDAKTYLEALETLHGACDLVIDAAKATRKPRKKAPPSKEKMVAKLKYLERDDKLQIVSVNPLELIDSKEVWVYNIKTRKLGKYVADEHATIRVKGTTLLHYNEKSSIQKTLRKPDETLKEFKKASKVKLRKFMDEIKTTDIKLNGRLNADTIILKVY